MPAPDLAAVQPGDSLPGLKVTFGAAQVFFFSAAVYNGHRIHYDQPYATQVEGHPGVLVQGALQAALLARVATDWAGATGRLVRFSVRNRGSVYLGESLTFTGSVTSVRHENARMLVDLDLCGTNAAGEAILPGQACVSFPAPDEGARADSAPDPSAPDQSGSPT